MTSEEQAAADAAALAAKNNGGVIPPVVKQETPKVEPALTVVDAGGEDGEELKADDKGVIQGLTYKSFMRRVKGATSAELRKHFGTTDIAEILAERKELIELKAEKKKADLEKLSETEKLKVEKAEAEKERDLARTHALEVESRSQARETESGLKSHVLELVDKDDADDLLDKLARATNKGDVSTVREAKEWLDEYVAQHPKWKKGGGKTDTAADDKSKKDKDTADAAKAEKDKEGVRRVPASNANRPGRPAPRGAPGSGGEIDFKKASKGDILAATGYKL